MNTRLKAIEIVNFINENYQLKLKTVDAAAMTDDIDVLLNSDQNPETCDATDAP